MLAAGCGGDGGDTTITNTPPLSLKVTAVSSYSAQVGWTSSPPAGTTEFMIQRKEPGDPAWRPIDTVPLGTTSYADYLLWRGTTYKYRVEAIGSGGSTVETKSVTTLDGTIPRLYSDQSFWNRTIAQDYPNGPPIQAQTRSLRKLVGHREEFLRRSAGPRRPEP